MDTARAPLRAAAIAAFTVGTILFLIDPPSLSGAAGLLTFIGGGIVLTVLAAWGAVALMGEGPSEAEFDRVVRRSEALAKMPVPEAPPDEFDGLVSQAIDDLPATFRELLKVTPVVISGRGREYRAYGNYIGDTVARDDHPDRIVIYRDTLERDFGHDPDALRAQVERTLRHELAHHLGWNEQGVRELGL
ncbi:MAG: metallopeptidase family protein [Thermoleophilaceae bacterium]